LRSIIYVQVLPLAVAENLTSNTVLTTFFVPYFCSNRFTSASAMNARTDDVAFPDHSDRQQSHQPTARPIVLIYCECPQDGLCPVLVDWPEGCQHIEDEVGEVEEDDPARQPEPAAKRPSRDSPPQSEQQLFLPNTVNRLAQIESTQRLLILSDAELNCLEARLFINHWSSPPSGRPNVRIT
jgi:hypothetical protein